jgi:hypothetical protein
VSMSRGGLGRDRVHGDPAHLGPEDGQLHGLAHTNGNYVISFPALRVVCTYFGQEGDDLGVKIMKEKCMSTDERLMAGIGSQGVCGGAGMQQGPPSSEMFPVSEHEPCRKREDHLRQHLPLLPGA